MKKAKKEIATPEVLVQEQLQEIKRRIKSIQWCLTIYSSALLAILILRFN